MSDVYKKEQQNEREAKLRKFDRMFEDKTFEERNESLFTFAEIFKMAFPIVSGLTLGFAAFRLIFGELGLIDTLDRAAIIANVVYFVLASIGVVGVEMLKANTLNGVGVNMFKEGRSVKFGQIVIVMLCIFISISGSSLGGYLLTLDLTDKSYAINQEAVIRNEAADEALALELKGIDETYAVIIAERTAEVQKWHPVTYKTKRKQATDRLERTKDDKERAKAAARKRVETEKNRRTNTASGNAVVSSTRARNFALVGGGIVLILEIMNLLSVTFFWKYIKRTVEDVKTSLQPSAVPSAGVNTQGQVVTTPDPKQEQQKPEPKVVEKIVYKTAPPPNNTGKNYNTGSVQGATKADRMVAHLRAWRTANPDGTKKQAVDFFTDPANATDDTPKRTSVYTHWDNATP